MRRNLPSGGAPSRLDRKRGAARVMSADTWHLWVMSLFWVALLLFGGASRADEPAQIVVRVASILTLALLWPAARAMPRPELRPVLWVFAAAMALVGAQLIPLPPTLWTELPGRAPYADLAGLLGTSQPWRPINLTPALGWNALLALLPCFAVLVIVAAIGRERLFVTVAAVAAAALFSAVMGVAQLGEGDTPFLRAYRIATASQPSGIFANRNHQALLLVLSIPCLAIWAAHGTRMQRRIDPRTKGIIALGAALLLVMALLATGSRAGLLLLAPAALAGVYFSRGLFAKGRRSRRWVLIVIAAIVIAAISAMILADRSTSIQRLFAADPVTDKRSANFPALVEMARTFFPVGSGFGSFEPVFRRFEPYDTLTFTYFNEAHNDPLQVVIEGGLAGILLAAAYLFLWARWSWRAWARPSSASPLPQLGSVVTSLCMIASVVDYPLRTPTLACVFVLATAWLASARGRRVLTGSDDTASASHDEWLRLSGYEHRSRADAKRTPVLETRKRHENSGEGSSGSCVRALSFTLVDR